MEHNEKNILQLVLESERDIKNWFEQLVHTGRKFNTSVKVIGNEQLSVTKDGFTETINLDKGLEELKVELIALKEKNPLGERER